MAIIKATFFMECNCYGWSESWYKDFPSSRSLESIVTSEAQALAEIRQGMLASPAKLVALSVSDESVDGDSDLRYRNMDGTCPGLADSPHTGILVTCRSHSPKGRKHVFIRGQPDDVVMNGGRFIPAAPGDPAGAGVVEFIIRGTSYFEALKSGEWGWMANSQTAVGTIDSFEVDPVDRRVILTTSPLFLPAIVPGGKEKFHRISINFKGRKTVLNGVHIAQQLDGSRLAIMREMNPFAIGGTVPGSIIRYTPVLRTFETGTWSFQKTTRRAAGKVLNHTPGREPAQALA
jgi:hypothetical protein